MNLKSKIAIDKIIGPPSILITRWCLSLFTLFKIKNPENKIKKIAVGKFAGMGSIIQSTPLLQTLKKNFPEAEIIFISSAKNKALLESFPFIDTIKVVDDSSLTSLISTSISLISYLIKSKIDHYFDMEIYSYYSALITSFNISGKRYGLYKKSTDLKNMVYTGKVFFNTTIPVSQVYLEYAELLNCKEPVTELYNFKDKKAKYHKPGIPQPYIVINPNASDLRLERRWSAENFILLINKLSESFPSYNLVLIGSANEKEYVKKIYDKAIERSKKVFDTTGLLTINELISLIDGSDLMITNDTGPMHLSIALKKNTVALFGPCSPEQYRVPRNAKIIYKKVHCSPCVHDSLVSPCKGDNQCMKKITVEEVFSICKEI